MISKPGINANPLTLCAGLPYYLEAPPECQNAKSFKWMVIGPLLPPGVSVDDIDFWTQYSLNTWFTVPKDGVYYIYGECCN